MIIYLAHIFLWKFIFLLIFNSKAINWTGVYIYIYIFSFSFLDIEDISLSQEYKNVYLGQAWWLTPVIRALWEVEVGGWLEARSSRPSWSTRWNPVSTKNTKIIWAWWCTPVVPATGEAEAEELPEPRRRRLWWAEIVPLHSSLGNKSETPSQKKSNLNTASEDTLIGLVYHTATD